MSKKRILIIVSEEQAERARAEGYTKTEAGAYIIDPESIVIPEPEWPTFDGMFPTPNRKNKA